MPITKRQLSDSPTLRDRPVVLVAEDDAEMRRFITEALRDRVRVVACSDGRKH